MRAMLTRDDDYFVPLAVACRRRAACEADLFVSIHADAFASRDARGSSVFALSERGATSAAARWLAQTENAADLIGGVNLDVQRSGACADAARPVADRADQRQPQARTARAGRASATINALHKGSVEQAGFAVLKAPDIPSILVETAFISNPDEELKLRSDRHQAKFAESMSEWHPALLRGESAARARADRGTG